VKKILIIVLAVGMFQGYRHFNKQELSGFVEAHDEVIMYSLTTCGYCKTKAKSLEEAGIKFTEYYIDEDAARFDELDEKLQRAGLSARDYGAPILDVRGTILPNNPSMGTIRKYMGES